MKFFTSSRKHRTDKENDKRRSTNDVVNGGSLSPRTGGFEMNHEYSCDYDTLADSTIYTDGCLRSAGPSLGHEAMPRNVPESSTSKAVTTNDFCVSEKRTPKQSHSMQYSRPVDLKGRSTPTMSSNWFRFQSDDMWCTDSTPPASPTGRSSSTRSTARCTASPTMSSGTLSPKPKLSSANTRASNPSPESTQKHRFKTLEPTVVPTRTQKKESTKEQRRKSDDSESESFHSVSFHDSRKRIERLRPVVDATKKNILSEQRIKEGFDPAYKRNESKTRPVREVKESPTRAGRSDQEHAFGRATRDASSRTNRSIFAPIHPVDIDEVSSSSSDSSLALNLGSRINVSDSSLMERSTSPGSLRLTEDYLKQHERKCFKEILYEKPLDSLEKWKRKKLADQLHRTHLEYRDDHRSSSRETPRSPYNPSRDGSSPQPHVLRLLAVPFRKSEADIGDMSLAPLSNMEDLHLTDSVTSKSGKKSGFWPFRSRSDSSSTAQELLQKEREAAKVMARIHEEQEKQRIEKKRRLYLEHQRLREAQLAEEQVSRSTSPKSLRSISIIEKANRERLSSQDVSTVSSTATPLPLCVVCHARERSHIATPCMHFSFCATCVRQLEGNKGNESFCPVCFEPDVTFAAVSV